MTLSTIRILWIPHLLMEVTALFCNYLLIQYEARGESNQRRVENLSQGSENVTR